MRFSCFCNFECSFFELFFGISSNSLYFTCLDSTRFTHRQIVRMYTVLLYILCQRIQHVLGIIASSNLYYRKFGMYVGRVYQLRFNIMKNGRKPLEKWNTIHFSRRIPIVMRSFFVQFFVFWGGIFMIILPSFRLEVFLVRRMWNWQFFKSFFIFICVFSKASSWNLFRRFGKGN